MSDEMPTPEEQAKQIVAQYAEDFPELVQDIAAALQAEGDRRAQEAREQALEADAIILNALEAHGSQVVFDSQHGIVTACPVSSLCEGTADHENDCWLGQALRRIPTTDCPIALEVEAYLKGKDNGR